MAQKRGLGKGLDSLITDKYEEKITYNNTNLDENVSRETLININDIEPNGLQPRSNFDEDSLQELSESIKNHGIIQPLIVQKKDKLYEIIAGERRWRAARIAGLKEVPVLIKEYSPEEAFEIALIENIQREDLNPIEEALAYQHLIQEFEMKQDEVAERVSKSRVAVTNAMRLLKLDSRVQQMVIDDMISAGHARALLGLKDFEQQFVSANQVFDEKLSVRDTEKLVKKLLKDKKEKETKVLCDIPIYSDLEEKLKFILGSKVEIRRTNDNKGKIVIDYYSADEFERIYELITTNK